MRQEFQKSQPHNSSIDKSPSPDHSTTRPRSICPRRISKACCSTLVTGRSVTLNLVLNFKKNHKERSKQDPLDIDMHMPRLPTPADPPKSDNKISIEEKMIFFGPEEIANELISETPKAQTLLMEAVDSDSLADTLEGDMNDFIKLIENLSDHDLRQVSNSLKMTLQTSPNYDPKYKEEVLKHISNSYGTSLKTRLLIAGTACTVMFFVGGPVGAITFAATYGALSYFDLKKIKNSNKPSVALSKMALADYILAQRKKSENVKIVEDLPAVVIRKKIVNTKKLKKSFECLMIFGMICLRGGEACQNCLKLRPSYAP